MAEYLSGAYLADVKRRAGEGRDPWVAALANLSAAAEEALAQPRLSVRDNGGSPFFRQDAVYVEKQDGVIDPDSNRKSGKMAGQLSGCTLDLALGYRLLDDERYAAKAVELIHAWCLNTDTRMYPTGNVFDPQTPGGRHGGDIIAFAAFNDLFLACYLLRGYPGWNLKCHAAVKRWIGAMVDAQRELMFFQGREMYNNWEDARLMYLAKGALATDDLDLLCYVFDRWQMTLPLKMTEEGELHRETMRTRSMHYTLFALDSTMQIAEIARQFGVNLYDCEINGRSLRKAVDYATHYLLNMEEWPHQLITPFSGQGEESARFRPFEMAYNYWGDERYLQVIKTHCERPLTKGYGSLLFARDE